VILAMKSPLSLMACVVRVARMGVLCTAACGAGAEPPRKPAKSPEPPAEISAARVETPPAPVINQELGSIDKSAVERVLRTLENQTEACHEQGRDRIDYLAGDAKVFLRIDVNGKVTSSYFEESTLGDREVEKCILHVFEAASWPKPRGGEAEVRHSFGWGSGDERKPTAWWPEKVTSALAGAPSVRKAINLCKAGVVGSFHVTAYVVPDVGSADVEAVQKPVGRRARRSRRGRAAPQTTQPPGAGSGRFQALGVGTSTKQAAERADCIVDALVGLGLPSPGSYPAKVSFTL